MNRREVMMSAAGLGLLGSETRAEEVLPRIAKKQYESWQVTTSRAIRETHDRRAIKKWEQAKNFSPWSPAAVAQLMEQQHLIDSLYGFKPRHEEVGPFLTSLFAPHLVHTEAMRSPNDFHWYERNRVWDDKIVRVTEMEELYTGERKTGLHRNDWYGLIDNSIINPGRIKHELTREQMVDQIDLEIVYDLIVNSGTVTTCGFSLNEIDQKIAEVFGAMDKNDTPDRVLVANDKLAADWTGTGRAVSQNFGFYGERNGVKVYGTHLLYPGAVLLADRSHKGYVFAPYLCFTPECDETRFATAYAKKLLREGARGFATIRLK